MAGLNVLNPKHKQVIDKDMPQYYGYNVWGFKDERMPQGVYVCGYVDRTTY